MLTNHLGLLKESGYVLLQEHLSLNTLKVGPIASEKFIKL